MNAPFCRHLTDLQMHHTGTNVDWSILHLGTVVYVGKASPVQCSQRPESDTTYPSVCDNSADLDTNATLL